MLVEKGWIRDGDNTDSTVCTTGSLSKHLEIEKLERAGLCDPQRRIVVPWGGHAFYCIRNLRRVSPSRSTPEHMGNKTFTTDPTFTVSSKNYQQWRFNISKTLRMKLHLLTKRWTGHSCGYIWQRLRLWFWSRCHSATSGRGSQDLMSLRLKDSSSFPESDRVGCV